MPYPADTGQGDNGVINILIFLKNFLLFGIKSRGKYTVHQVGMSFIRLSKVSQESLISLC
jgi:hypothetical protein